MKRAVGWLLLLVPALWAAVLVGHYGVDFPLGDQWAAEAPILEKMQLGTLGWGDFFAPFNEHRIFFPRLVFYVLARATHWNVRAELWVILGLAGIIAFNFWRVARDTGWNAAGVGYWLLLAANVLVFSPLHYENFLWGFQIGFLLPLACLTACLWVGRLASVGARFLGVFALSIVCSFSVAGGCMAWLIGLPLLWEAGGEGRWTRYRGWWFAWAVGFVGSVVLYFHGNATTSLANVSLLLREPGPAEKFWLTYLGLPFAYGTSLDPFAVAQAAAAVMLTVLVAALGYLWRRGDGELMRRCLPWLLLVAIALLNAALTTLGRFRFGLLYALTSRYVIFAICLPIGLSFVCAAIYRHRQMRIPPGLVALGSGMAVLHLLGALNIAATWKDFSHRARMTQALVETLGIVDEPELLGEYIPDLPARDRLVLLARGGFVRSPPIKTEPTGEITDAGQLESAGARRDGRFRVRGWAVLPDARRPADAVLLTCEDAQGRATIFALAVVGAAREDIAELRQDSAFARCGWEKVIAPGKLPDYARVVRAWSFDAETGRAYALPGQAIVPKYTASQDG